MNGGLVCPFYNKSYFVLDACEISVRLPNGNTEQYLSPTKNLKCRVTLRFLDHNAATTDEYYAVFNCENLFECAKEYSERTDQHYVTQRFSTKFKRHAFLMKYNDLLKCYVASFGDGTDEHQLQLLEDGVYMCKFWISKTILPPDSSVVHIQNSVSLYSIIQAPSMELLFATAQHRSYAGYSNLFFLTVLKDQYSLPELE